MSRANDLRGTAADRTARRRRQRSNRRQRFDLALEGDARMGAVLTGLRSELEAATQPATAEVSRRLTERALKRVETELDIRALHGKDASPEGGKAEAMSSELETELRAALDTINAEAEIALEGGKASWETVYEQSDRSADGEGGS